LTIKPRKGVQRNGGWCDKVRCKNLSRPCRRWVMSRRRPSMQAAISRPDWLGSGRDFNAFVHGSGSRTTQRPRPSSEKWRRGTWRDWAAPSPGELSGQAIRGARRRHLRHFPFDSYGRKWLDRKGRAIHTKSDFMRPLYEWGDALFANAVKI
jgi:hypothetical protein